MVLLPRLDLYNSRLLQTTLRLKFFRFRADRKRDKREPDARPEAHLKWLCEYDPALQGFENSEACIFCIMKLLT
jgi:hypothetical protein